MFASDLSFSKAVMAARQSERRHGAAQRVYRLPAARPSPRTTPRGER